MNDTLFLIGIILLIAGFLILIASLVSGDSKMEFVGGGFIGPIPFGFASDPKYLKYVILILAVLLVYLLLIN